MAANVAITMADANVCVFALSGNALRLDSSTAFAALAWFDILRQPLFAVAGMITDIVQIIISFRYSRGS